jgi:ABC-type Fe3+ transport system substrate-binding protein
MFPETQLRPRVAGGVLLLLCLAGCGDEDGGPGPTPAEARSFDDLVASALSEDPAIWYDSSPDDQGRAVTEAFATRFPGASVRHVRLVGGLDIAARMVLEARTRGEAADVATLAAEQAHGLHERKLLAEVPWQALGVNRAMVAAPHALATATAVFVLLYNPELVAAPPASWEDLLAPDWAGRFGTWVSPHALVQLVPSLGNEEATRYAARFAAQEPVLFRSTFPLVQAIAAGDLAAGVGVWHAAKPLISAGAPVRVSRLSPTPVSTLYTVVAAGATSPNTGRLFAVWLASPEGALAYETATGRGNRRVAATETAAFLEGAEVSEFPFYEVAAASEWMARFGAELRSGRTVRP